MHSQQQPPFEAGRTQFGHYDHLDNFADAQQVVQIGVESEPLVDQYAIVSLPPKIQRPVFTPSRTLSDSAMANRCTSTLNHNFPLHTRRSNPPIEYSSSSLAREKGVEKDMTWTMAILCGDDGITLWLKIWTIGLFNSLG
jgi:hypothetical protein